MDSSTIQRLLRKQEEDRLATTCRSDNSCDDANMPPPPYTSGNDDELPEDDEETVSHHLELDASTQVTGTGNIVHVETVAATTARAVAAISSILREYDHRHLDTPANTVGTASTSNMNDRSSNSRNDGRPLRVRLNMGVRVQGVRNAVVSEGSRVRQLAATEIPHPSASSTQASPAQSRGQGQPQQQVAGQAELAQPTQKGQGELTDARKRKTASDEETNGQDGPAESAKRSKTPP